METEVKVAYDKLEQRVQERTAELAHTTEELRRASERFELGSRAVNSVIFELDIANNRIVNARGLKEVLGYDDDEIGPGLDGWRSRIHPDDLPAVKKELRNVFRKNKDFYAEYR